MELTKEFDQEVASLIKSYNKKATRLFKEENLDIKELKIKAVRVRKYSKNVYYYDLVPYYKELPVYNQVKMATFYTTPIDTLERKYLIALYRFEIAIGLKINGLTFF